MEVFIAIICIIFGVLQIVLFFKIWGMTNNIKDIKEIYCDGVVSSGKSIKSVVRNLHYNGKDTKAVDSLNAYIADALINYAEEIKYDNVSMEVKEQSFAKKRDNWLNKYTPLYGKLGAEIPVVLQNMTLEDYISF